MIFNIRGANGSGKSYVVRQLFDTAPTETIIQETHSERRNLFDSSVKVQKKVRGYHQPSRNLRIVGSYESNCGGCDTIDTQQEVKDRILEFASLGHVLFEGMIISGLIHVWITFSRSAGGMVWCYLDTPLDVCIANVYKRNGGKQIIESQVVDKWKRCQQQSKTAEREGEKVVWLDHKNPLKSFLKVFKQYA